MIPDDLRRDRAHVRAHDRDRDGLPWAPLPLSYPGEILGHDPILGHRVGLHTGLHVPVPCSLGWRNRCLLRNRDGKIDVRENESAYVRYRGLFHDDHLYHRLERTMEMLARVWGCCQEFIRNDRETSHGESYRLLA